MKQTPATPRRSESRPIIAEGAILDVECYAGTTAPVHPLPRPQIKEEFQLGKAVERAIYSTMTMYPPDVSITGLS